MTQQLYNRRGARKDSYFTVIGTASDGTYVLENTASGMVYTNVSARDLMPVARRSIQVRFEVATGGTIYNYMLTQEDPKISKGDILIKTDQGKPVLVHVVGVNNPTQEPHKFFKGKIVETRGDIG